MVFYQRPHPREDLTVCVLQYAQFLCKRRSSPSKRREMFNFSTKLGELAYGLASPVALPCPFKRCDSLLQELRRGFLCSFGRIRDLTAEPLDINRCQHLRLRFPFARRAGVAPELFTSETDETSGYAVSSSNPHRYACRQ